MFGAYRRRRRSRGQSLAEFALVAPVFFAMLAGTIQFGLLFWAQNTLTQVVRDTGRWAATQQSCSAAAVNFGSEFNAIASNASLFGYTPTWPVNDVTDTANPYSSAGDSNVAGFTTADQVAVAWVVNDDPTNEGCPPKDNQAFYHVSIKANLRVPTFFPGMEYLPGLGTCNSSGCHIVLSSSVQYRLEPKP